MRGQEPNLRPQGDPDGRHRRVPRQEPDDGAGARDLPGSIESDVIVAEQQPYLRY